MCEALGLVSSSGNKQARRKKKAGGRERVREKARKEKEEEERKNENICLSEFLIIKVSFRDRSVSYEGQHFCPWRKCIR